MTETLGSTADGYGGAHASLSKKDSCIILDTERNIEFVKLAVVDNQVNTDDVCIRDALVVNDKSAQNFQKSRRSKTPRKLMSTKSKFLLPDEDEADLKNM